MGVLGPRIPRTSQPGTGPPLVTNIGGARSVWAWNAASPPAGTIITGAKLTITNAGIANGFGATLGVGANDVVEIPFSRANTQRSYLFVCLPRGITTAAAARLLEKKGTANGEAVLTTAGTGPSFGYSRLFSGSTALWAANSVTVTNGTLYAVVTTYDDSSASNLPTIVINGVNQAVTTTTAPVGTATAIAGNYILGNRVDNLRVFDGRILLGVAFDGLMSVSDAIRLTQVPSVSPWQLFAPIEKRIWVPVSAAGITFDAAGNSGDLTAVSSYSGSASWAGTNRLLAIDVSLLGPGVTVTAMTYGGAACTFIGARSTVTSFGRIEQWRICSSDAGAPAAGTNTLSVTLSGSLEFVVTWASYASVHQSFPVEAFNSAQATNAGTANNAVVAITTVADNCWLHAAVVADDTSITAVNTSRNNVSGVLGSGANEDFGSALTPPGAQNMSYSGLGLTTTWAIAGYAIRPLTASGVAGTSATTNANDTSAGSGTTAVVGTSARTNANDSSVGVASTTVVGTSARTNANDSSAGSGAAGSSVSGSSATTNANDSSAGAGTTTIVGTSARINANDTSAGAGTTTVVGTSARTNANDASAGSGVVGTVAGTAVTTNANDVSSGSGAAGQGTVNTGFYGWDAFKPTTHVRPRRTREDIREDILEVLAELSPPPAEKKAIAQEVIREIEQIPAVYTIPVVDLKKLAREVAEIVVAQRKRAQRKRNEEIIMLM